MTINTLEWIKKEANEIAGSWNGEDSQFQAGGVTYNEDHAHAATELLEKIKEVENLMEELGMTI